MQTFAHTHSRLFKGCPVPFWSCLFTVMRSRERRGAHCRRNNSPEPTQTLRLINTGNNEFKNRTQHTHCDKQPLRTSLPAPLPTVPQSRRQTLWRGVRTVSKSTCTSPELLSLIHLNIYTATDKSQLHLRSINQFILLYSTFHNPWMEPKVQLLGHRHNLLGSTTAMDLTWNKDNVLWLQTSRCNVRMFSSKSGDRCRNYSSFYMCHPKLGRCGLFLRYFIVH